MKKTGRPTNYTDELGDEICSAVAGGRALAGWCNEKDSRPDPATVYRWLRTFPQFRQNYEQAKEDQADFMVEEMLDIADNQASNSVEIDGEIHSMVDAAGVSHARLRVDTRKWAASKFKPKKYGDKLTTKHEGSLQLTDMTEDALDAKLADLLKSQ